MLGHELGRARERLASAVVRPQVSCSFPRASGSMPLTTTAWTLCVAISRGDGGQFGVGTAAEDAAVHDVLDAFGAAIHGPDRRLHADGAPLEAP